MLPETFAPFAEILPSLTVSVELAVGSQLPLFVTIVTFQVPSYGCWARAGVAEAAKVKTKNGGDAIEAHASDPRYVCDGPAYLRQMCPKFAASQHHRLFL